MSQYAVIRINHRQYLVETGKTYSVDKFAAEIGDKFTPEVLLVSNGEEIQIGSPVLENKVELEIIDQGKGEKVRSFKYHAKSRYRKRFGLRKRVTKFKVNSIK